MGILWGFLTAFGWGTADFMARGVSMRLGAWRALLYAQLVSFVCLLVLTAWNLETAEWTFGVLALGALLGGLNVLGSMLLYRALSVGRLAIISPIASSFAAITLMLSLLTGDVLSIGKIAGLVLTVIGVIMASTPELTASEEERKRGTRGIPEAIGAALAFGITFWGLKYVVPTLGPWVPVLESRIIALALLPLLARPFGQSVALPDRVAWRSLIGIGLLDTFANVSYNLGIQSDAPGVVAVLGSLFSPITVLLGFVILHERLSQRQWIGVLVIFMAVTLIGIADNLVAL
jgi:drug/metabolite transporter (DMT)-like permease